MTAIGVERDLGPPVAAYVVDADGSPVAEAVAAAVIAGGFGLLAMEPAAVNLEALFLRLTGERVGA